MAVLGTCKQNSCFRCKGSETASTVWVNFCSANFTDKTKVEHYKGEIYLADLLTEPKYKLITVVCVQFTLQIRSC